MTAPPSDVRPFSQTWSVNLAKFAFWFTAVPIIVIGALQLWGMPSPSFAVWLFFGVSPESFLAYPITAITALTAGLIVSAPFWLLALIMYVFHRERLKAAARDSPRVSDPPLHNAEDSP